MVNDYIFNSFLINNKKRIEFLRKELSLCPEGKLYEQKKNGRTYYIQVIYNKGKQIHTGINSKPETINALIRKELYEKELQICLQRQDAVLQMEKNWPAFDLRREILLFEEKHPGFNERIIANAIQQKALSEWASAEYEKSDYKPEEKKQINSHGLRVRSKSEVLITEKLYEHSIEFRYEQVMTIGKIKLNPDFTIRRSDGKIFIWEHEGLTNVKTYLDWQTRKSQLYASVGVVPWDNLIVTYDNDNGIIDLRIVEAEIKNKLLI